MFLEMQLQSGQIDAKALTGLIADYFTYAHAIERILQGVGAILGIKVEPKPEWIESDPDCLQYGAQVSDNEFEFIEVRKSGPIEIDNGYDVCRGHVDLCDYDNEELCSYTSPFYPTIAEIFRDYGEDAGRIIAECIFETMPLIEMVDIMHADTWDVAEGKVRDLAALPPA